MNEYTTHLEALADLVKTSIEENGILPAEALDIGQSEEAREALTQIEQQLVRVERAREKYVCNFTFYEDPGHGWLCVPLALLRELEIDGRITRYSYFKHGQQVPREEPMVYLEEDCDLTLFMNRARQMGYVINMTEEHTNGDSWIRNLPAYDAKKAAA